MTPGLYCLCSKIFERCVGRVDTCQTLRNCRGFSYLEGKKKTKRNSCWAGSGGRREGQQWVVSTPLFFSRRRQCLTFAPGYLEEGLLHSEAGQQNWWAMSSSSSSLRKTETDKKKDKRRIKKGWTEDREVKWRRGRIRIERNRRKKKRSLVMGWFSFLNAVPSLGHQMSVFPFLSAATAAIDWVNVLNGGEAASLEWTGLINVYMKITFSF